MVMAEAGGFLEKFTPKTGQYLPAGAAIAVFATEATRLKLERAQLQVFNAQKEYESQLLGYEKLFESMNETQRADVREKLRISSGLAPALQDVKEAEYELSKAIIKAPFAGVAANVAVRQGEHIKPGTELCRLYNPAQLVLAAKVLESDLPFMQKNLLASVQALGSTQQVSARLYDINPLVDENGMVTVRLMLQSKGTNPLFVGMHARATIQVPAKKTLAVPRDALLYRGGRAVVFTFINGLAKWNYVNTGLDNGKEVEITEGLNPGDEVIVSNNIQLAHDSPVTKTTGQAEGGKP
jgi:RND family efflux transporter MFP subunit